MPSIETSPTRSSPVGGGSAASWFAAADTTATGSFTNTSCVMALSASVTAPSASDQGSRVVPDVGLPPNGRPDQRDGGGAMSAAAGPAPQPPGAGQPRRRAPTTQAQTEAGAVRPFTAARCAHTTAADTGAPASTS